MKGDMDWQKTPAVLTNRLVVKVTPKSVRIVFGEVGETEVSFHTAVAMTLANAEGLAKAILQGLTKTKGRSYKALPGANARNIERRQKCGMPKMVACVMQSSGAPRLRN